MRQIIEDINEASLCCGIVVLDKVEFRARGEMEGFFSRRSFCHRPVDWRVLSLTARSDNSMIQALAFDRMR